MRRAGLLLPVSALPGRFGVGDFGPSARDWIAFLGAAGQRVWQVLPLTVADKHGCPYASPTGFATDPAFLSPEDLLEEGLITANQLPPAREGDVDWPTLRQERHPFLHAAGAALADVADLDAYVEREPWALDWARFAVHARIHGPQWWRWDRDPAEGLGDPDVASAVALQWGLDRQWSRLRRLARAHGVQIWGDLPFFVGAGSADVWARPDRFDLNDDHTPRTVTGVPPDAFSPDGQRWGHPHLDHEVHASEEWAWTRARARRALSQIDVLRLDHFRGLHEVWEVPGEDDTAANGRWVPGPGAALLERLMALAGPEHWVAEDLGVITPPVLELRDRAGLRGMAVLQFAFGAGSEAPFRPWGHRPHQVVYTGTHDNSTLEGWMQSSSRETLDHAMAYFGCGPHQLGAALRRACWQSVAETAILPVQDVLGLGDEARFNLPGTAEGNWRWRLRRAVLTPTLASGLREQAILAGRDVQ